MLGDPLTLFHDVLDHPDAYDEGLAVLLQEVVQGSKKLDELDKSDQRLLNDAVLVFAEGHRAPPPEVRPPDPKPAQPKQRAERTGTPIERVLAEHATPTTPAGPPKLPDTPPTFWWKKKSEKDQ